ncbi:MAG: hypothetical protein AAF495_25415 [Pseudomonadota bacterium]
MDFILSQRDAIRQTPKSEATVYRHLKDDPDAPRGVKIGRELYLRPWEWRAFVWRHWRIDIGAELEEREAA